MRNSMSLQADINWIHQQVDKIRDPKFLSIVKNLFEYREAKSQDVPYNDDDYIEELGCTVGEYNNELDEAERDVRNGNFYMQEEVEKMFDIK